jgi:hypothetical protein
MQPLKKEDFITCRTLQQKFTFTVLGRKIKHIKLIKVFNFLKKNTKKQKKFLNAFQRLFSETKCCPVGVEVSQVSKSFIFSFGVLEFELRALQLLSRCSTTQAILLVPPCFWGFFALIIFQIGSLVSAQDQPWTVIFTFHIVGITVVNHYTQLVGRDGILLIFPPELALNHNPPDLCLPSS